MFLLLPWRHCPKNLPVRAGRKLKGMDTPPDRTKHGLKGLQGVFTLPKTHQVVEHQQQRVDSKALGGSTTRFFWSRSSSFFLLHHPFFIQEKLMAFKKERFSFEAEENHFMKLQQLSGKHSFQTKDFQRIVEKMIDRMYVQTKGKELK